MSSHALENLVALGLLKKEAPRGGEVESLQQTGVATLTDSQNPELSLESRFELAYAAAFALSLAALRRQGYRPDNNRYLVFQALPHTIGLAQPQVRVLDKAHTLRNNAAYEGYFDVDERLLRDTIAATQIVLAALKVDR